jgi:16S rRNA (adenine1518-N6/adenine1519-N6)-dimethyltransferase
MSPNQTLSDIRDLLASRGLSPKHRLGQNFLHDGNLMGRIVEAAELSPEQIVLEVGPGTGALSLRLLEAGARLVTVEIDRDLTDLLATVLAPFAERSHVIYEDVLAGKRTINPRVIEALAALDPGRSSATPGFKLVANLPYQVASPLLANLAVDWPQMSMAVVTVQREVAARLCAAPGGKAYGPPSVIVQAMCEVEELAVIAPSCFWPPPKVESSIVRIRRLDEPLAGRPAVFADNVGRLFRHRRKQLGTVLRRELPQISLPADIDPSLRPEQLSVRTLVRLLG